MRGRYQTIGQRQAVSKLIPQNPDTRNSFFEENDLADFCLYPLRTAHRDEETMQERRGSPSLRKSSCERLVHRFLYVDSSRYCSVERRFALNPVNGRF